MSLSTAAPGVRRIYGVQSTKGHNQAIRAVGLMPRARAAGTRAVPYASVTSLDLSPGRAPHTPLPPFGQVFCSGLVPRVSVHSFMRNPSALLSASSCLISKISTCVSGVSNHFSQALPSHRSKFQLSIKEHNRKCHILGCSLWHVTGKKVLLHGSIPQAFSSSHWEAD